MQGLTMCCSVPLAIAMTISQHVYEVRPRKDKRGFDLISDALPFGRAWHRLRGSLQERFRALGPI